MADTAVAPEIKDLGDKIAKLTIVQAVAEGLPEAGVQDRAAAGGVRWRQRTSRSRGGC